MCIMKLRNVRIVAIFFGSIALGISALRGPLGAQTDDAPSVERGRYVATVLAGCADCHGANYAGGRAFTRGRVTVYAPNLTTGLGGIGAQSNSDERRAIRTGVKPDGTHVRVMPWREYAVMTDGDVDSVIAFLRALPPVDNRVPVAPVATVSGAGVSPPIATATEGDVDTPGSLVGAAYLVRLGGCTSCHGANLAGGISAGGVAAPNITHVGIGSWSFPDFKTAMRTGKSPGGHLLAGAMPWQRIGKMSDDELHSVYDYLESRPAPAN